LANAIGSAVGATALAITNPLEEPVDLLFLGAAVYAFGIDDALKDFIEKLSPALVKEVVVFSTTAVVTSAYPHVKKLLATKGIAVSEQEFHCRGEFAIMHKNRPNAQDCAKAEDFAKKIVKLQRNRKK
jgi:hypothetical protein